MGCRTLSTQSGYLNLGNIEFNDEAYRMLK
ncbi:hypothetical protein ABIE20_005539 [Pseudomonas sp. 2835]